MSWLAIIVLAMVVMGVLSLGGLFLILYLAKDVDNDTRPC